MRSPFHTVMTTPVLDVRELARLMHEQAARALVDTSRPAGVADAVLLGKLAMLDALAERVWGEDLSGTETASLQAAANELGRAVEALAGRGVRVDD